jgi:hypothetical protein
LLKFIALGLSFRKVGPGTFCTTMHQHILRALSLEFLAKWEIPVLYHPPYSPDLVLTSFYFLN